MATGTICLTGFVSFSYINRKLCYIWHLWTQFFILCINQIRQMFWAFEVFCFFSTWTLLKIEPACFVKKKKDIKNVSCTFDWSFQHFFSFLTMWIYFLNFFFKVLLPPPLRLLHTRATLFLLNFFLFSETADLLGVSCLCLEFECWVENFRCFLFTLSFVIVCIIVTSELLLLIDSFFLYYVPCRFRT